MQSFVTVAVWASIAATIGAGLACGLRQWRLATRVARTVALASPVLLAMMVVVFIILPLRTQGPSMEAIVLSKGISEVVTCGVLTLAAGLPASWMWVFARSRIRVDQKPAG